MFKILLMLILLSAPLAFAAARVDVKAGGAHGDGVTNDTAILQGLITANLSGTLYFPAGVYLLHNAGVNTPGLTFAGFSGTVIMATGSSFSCDTANTTAGQCIYVPNITGAKFYNLTISYSGIATLPMIRASSTSNALLVENAHSITFWNTTILGSSGSGAWNTNSTNITYAGLTSISRTTADGIHFENVANAVVENLYTDGTGDDALGDTNIAVSNPNCGLIVSNAQIHNSHSRGIAVAGGCNATLSNIQITGVAGSGIAVNQDLSISSRIPTQVSVSNATISQVGKLPGVAGNKYCLDIGNATYVTMSGVTCTDSGDDGVFIYNNSAHVLIQNVVLKSSGNNGFQVAASNNVSFVGDTAIGATGNGFDVESSSAVVMQSCLSDSAAGYGFYHFASTGVSELGLTSRNTAMDRGGRAWWAESMTGTTTVDGLAITDDQIVSTGHVVGDFNNSAHPVTVTNLSFALSHGASSVQHDVNSKYYLTGQGTPVP